MYVSQLPIPMPTADRKQSIELLANAIIELKGEGPTAAYLERLLNGLVYELFFPDDLHAQKLCFFDLVAAARIRKNAVKTDWEAFHEQISGVNHPIYAALFALNGLEVVPNH